MVVESSHKVGHGTSPPLIHTSSDREFQLEPQEGRHQLKMMDTSIPRIVNVSKDSFVRDFLEPQQPVIIAGVADNWPAYSKWSFDYLRNTVGSKKVPVLVDPVGGPPRGGSPARQNWQLMPIAQCLDSIEHTPLSGGEKCHIAQQPTQDLPELKDDFSPPPLIAAETIKATNLWIGPAGKVTQLHHDTSDNFLCQVKGRKRLTLFDPSQSEYLYPNATENGRYHVSRMDIDSPDLELFPRYRNAKPIECMLHAGEILYLPAFWWHQVYTIDIAISLNFWWPAHIRNYVNRTAEPHLARTVEDIPAMFVAGTSRTTGFSDLLDVASYALQRGEARFAVLSAGAALKALMIVLCQKYNISLQTEAGGKKSASVLHENLRERCDRWRHESADVPTWIVKQLAAAGDNDIGYNPADVSETIDRIRQFKRAMLA